MRRTKNVAAKATNATNRVAAGTAMSVMTGAATPTRTLTVKTDRAMRQSDAGGTSEAVKAAGSLEEVATTETDG